MGKTIHKMSNTPTYVSWAAMKQRCRYKQHVAYARYGANGITIDPEWLKFSNFLKDMGVRPPGTTLDRKNNLLGYNKNNCKWSTPHEQGCNTSVNVFIEIDGERKCISEWAKATGLPMSLIGNRHRRGVTGRDLLDPDRSFAKHSKRKTHCPFGHAYDEANTRHYGGQRFCRACNRRRGGEHRAKIRGPNWTPRPRRKLWNRCDECGKIIPLSDFDKKRAVRRMVLPDSDRSAETWETLCRNHYKP